MTPALILPTDCPVDGCGVWLQHQHGRPEVGVRPHFDACHPGMPVPTAVSGGRR